jgi:hypothetical protein
MNCELFKDGGELRNQIEEQFWRQGNLCVDLESGLCCLMEMMKNRLFSKHVTSFAYNIPRLRI